MIRNATVNDAPWICDIYNHYIESTTITFEEDPVCLAEMEKRITTVCASMPWMVYEEKGRVLGYAYADGWKARSAYRFSVEATVYLEKGSTGRGIGAELYRRLLDELRGRGIHAVMAGIALPNETSRRLHERLGFEKVAHFKEAGLKFNKWIDVGYWELILNG